MCIVLAIFYFIEVKVGIFRIITIQNLPFSLMVYLFRQEIMNHMSSFFIQFNQFYWSYGVDQRSTR